MRYQRRAHIDPIHVEELLAGAGMSGFLGVLDPPAPVAHLQALAGQASYVRAEPSQLSLCFSSRLEELSTQLGRQQEMLLEISRVAGRINGAAERLNLRAQAFIRRHARAPEQCETRQAAWSPACNLTKGEEANEEG